MRNNGFLLIFQPKTQFLSSNVNSFMAFSKKYCACACMCYVYALYKVYTNKIIQNTHCFEFFFLQKLWWSSCHTHTHRPISLFSGPTEWISTMTIYLSNPLLMNIHVVFSFSTFKKIFREYLVTNTFIHLEKGITQAEVQSLSTLCVGP